MLNFKFVLHSWIAFSPVPVVPLLSPFVFVETTDMEQSEKMSHAPREAVWSVYHIIEVCIPTLTVSQTRDSQWIMRHK